MKATGVAVLVLTLVLSVCAEKKRAMPAQETLSGRVIARVHTLHYGSSLSHKWMVFFFALEDPHGNVKPIEIAYAFYKPNQLPPDSFWDYSRVYEIAVQRDPVCDTKVEDLAYERNFTKELPPSFVLGYAKGAPTDLLKREAVLPCYTLWYGNYRQIHPSAK
jgi:hypothetical protein